MNKMSATHIRTDEPDGKRKSKKITPFDMIRAASTIVVFGIPLIAGTAAVLGYGAYKAFQKLKR
ncbi:MAG: hypothetical protein PHU49_11565 [Syntrophorhabdaceae bacterium]|nr:hypothetical protein [Syntrophorhabdaceae bacterium]MDD5244642.1 hypothetical protein [Syntrophorhabdaceae bacterium]